MIKGKGLFYANDKSLYDALTQKKIKNSDLSKLFISRGILISSETERNETAKYFCRLNHDYFDHQIIADVLGVIKRKDKSTFLRVKTDAKIEDIETILNGLSSDIETLGDRARVQRSQTSIQLTINYQSVNYGKTEFSQVTENEATIYVENINGHLTIRSPNTDYSNIVKEKIIDSLSKRSNDDIEITKISISPHISTTIKSQFFIDIAKNISGFEFDDITDVYVFNPENSDRFSDETESDMGVHIEKASLKGKGVLNSTTYNDLKSKGFYISKIVWKSKSKSKDKILEFEAQFSSPATCSDFSYQIKGEYLANRHGVFNKSKRSVSLSDEIRYQRLIEDSAYLSLSKIK